MRPEGEPAVDRARPGPDVPKALARPLARLVEAGAVVPNRDDPLAAPLADDDLRSPRARVLADVCESLLDDPEDLDLLVRGERDSAVDLQLDLELAVGGQELDVATEGGIEWRRAARRRQGQDGEARLLLRAGRGLLELRGHLIDCRAAFEPACVRRDREEVLREPVVDLPRDPGTLLGDGAAELRGADRAPDADEQHAVGEHADEVALREVAGR